MKLLKKLILFLIALSLFSCRNQMAAPVEREIFFENKVLLLKVDYLTNSFQGGKETIYPTNTSTFTITHVFISPSDFGNIKMTYQELNETLFDGGIVWAGTGRINYPQNIQPANQFSLVSTNDTIQPRAGFQHIFNAPTQPYDYMPVWLSIQKLAKVREYMNSNPSATVKLFLYTPGVGMGDPAKWSWIIFLKN